MYIIINKIADHYSLGDDITKFILQYVQRNLLNQGWKSMKSFDKSTQKMVKMKKNKNSYEFKDEIQYECFNTINNLYMENPRKGFFNLVNHYSSNRDPNIHYFILSKSLKYISFELSCFKSEKVFYNRRKHYELKTEHTIQQLRNFIIERELVPKLKKSLRRNQLINIILHDNPDYKIENIISPRESSRLWIENNRK